MNRKAQGTIEYLVIIGIIVVIGLVVVGLLNSLLGSSNKLNTTNTKIEGNTGFISITDAAIDSEGKGVFVFQPNTIETLQLTKLTINGADTILDEQLVGLNKNKIEITSLTDSCCQIEDVGEKICSIILTYTTPQGLVKTHTTNFVVNCVNNLILTNSPPTITEISPPDGNTTTETRISFIFTPNDSDGTITECNLNISGIEDANSILNPEENTPNTLQYTLTVGSFNWNISCTDNSGSTTTTPTRSITIESLIPTDGLISHWAFDGDANDSVSGYNGSVDGAILTTGVKGEANTAYFFDGEDDKIEIPNFSELNLQPPLTISAWIKFNSFASGTIPHQNNAVLNHRGIEPIDATNAIWLGYFNTHNANDLQFITNGNDENNVSYDFTTKQIDTWYHLLATYDGETKKLYLNGTKRAEQISTTSIDYNSARSMYIGADDDKTSFNDHFHGTIDEVRIYDKDLNTDEITTLYDAEKPVPA